MPALRRRVVGGRPGPGPRGGAQSAPAGQTAPARRPAGTRVGTVVVPPSAFPSNHLDHLSDLASNFANSGGLAAGSARHRGLSASGLTVNLAGGPTGGLDPGRARPSAVRSGDGAGPAPAHYGVTVNGFHPQVNARVNPVVPGAGMSHRPPSLGGAPGTLVRHGQPAVVSSVASSSKPSGSHARSSLERNQREAERAQKITRLITDIRVSMEEGGWKEEMKSKYQTLSQ